MTSQEFLAAIVEGRRDFASMDLRCIKVNGANLDDVRLCNANLSGAELIICSLIGADLIKADLSGAKLAFSNLSRACLTDAVLLHCNCFQTDFTDAVLERADLEHSNCWGATFLRALLSGASLKSCNLELADLTGANLSGASLKRANLKRATLRRTICSSTDLSGVNFYSAKLDDTIFTSARFYRTVLANVDLASVDLEDAVHAASSAVSHETLQLTAASLAKRADRRGTVETFLKGCGVEQHMIEYFVGMIGKPMEFYSAFVSYSHADRSFAQQLHDSLQARGIRCWLDEHDLRPGDRILDVVGEAIRLSDKLLLCCSMASLNSWWVKDEIRKAMERERREGRDLIVPLMLDDFLLSGWQDGLAAEVRSRLAANFTDWHSDPAIFEREIERVVEALRALGEPLT